MQDYFARHKAFHGGKEPDRWASSATYAGLQALQQAIERVGEIDRAKIIQELKTGTFKTVVGRHYACRQPRRTGLADRPVAGG